ncbi:hypothetical protein JX266_003361 [Neoarthrinium moseri]|uniref:uncharacterized protein n=1 Tax=Neoarthrinium moseri TaxID=1658444 RepID=UPI001FDDF0EF|nr:uncharacterized protein JN550_000733 [Neoarthrinium moseri]KAI1851286.1 hypothetical protein JX266_003361 [Neoarthrinium moseri]KAI1878551.1 hypothetical protein JN550_000733 [Neoarthrinium moseri]
MKAPRHSSATAAVAPRSDGDLSCSSINLPVDGVLTLSDGQVIKLTADASFQPSCADALQAKPVIIGNTGVTIDQTVAPATGSSSTSSSSSGSGIQLSDFRDPFYASTFPQCYALAATTIIAYTLVIMLFIAPRSFLDGGVVVLGRRGFTNGPSNGVSIGGRPWLQKVAALTVAISLTIATADTFRVAEDQYADGIQNAQALQDEVLNGTQLKIIRLISDTFLWLAQAQTLIRLFPRQREKIIIKWTAFSLITLDVIFGALNSFLYDGPGNARPRNFTDAVPALSYLFQLSLGLLYAAWVIYYSLMKKRYAYFHPLMKNISLMAVLSIISLLVPVVFFILDISKPDFTGWGDYVRWVGAAAASVVVWEWVERIEALEREEKKDGILGREVFDGDEMMDASNSDLPWPRRRRTKKKDEDDNNNNDGGESGRGGSQQTSSTHGRGNMWPAMSSIASRYMSRSGSNLDTREQRANNAAPAASKSGPRLLQPPLWISRPPPAATPISRTDTASADSTVYAVRYQPLTETTSRTTDDRLGRPVSRSNSRASSHPRERSPSPSARAEAIPPSSKPDEDDAKPSRWRSLTKFRPGVNGPPAEVAPHTNKPSAPRREYENRGWMDIRERMEDFAATQAERIREKMRPTPDTESLEVVVIPPPPRRGAALAQLMEEEQQPQAGAPSAPAAGGSTATGSSNASRAVPFPTIDTRAYSNTSNMSGPTLSPTQRNDTFPLTSARRDSAVSPTSPRVRNPAGERSNASPVSPLSPSAPRRPVDDIFGGGTAPS